VTQDLRTLISGFLDTCDDDFGIAVSGGSDSMALLHLIAECRNGPCPLVMTVNHGLRPEAVSEVHSVAEACAALGLKQVTLSWSGWDGVGNLQAEARAARYRLLADCARENGIGTVLLGHTADDVAETFLMRIARGSGIEGLSAMKHTFQRHGVTFARPLITASRADLRSYLTDRGLTWSDDPSNEDDSFQRVKMRKLLLDLAAAGLTVMRLQETATRLEDARLIVMDAVRDLASQATYGATGTISLNDASTNGVQPEVRRLFWTKVIQWMGQTDYAPRADAVSGCLNRARNEGRAQVGGCDLLYENQTLILMREGHALRDIACPTSEIWDGKWQLSGPHAASLKICALGEKGLLNCPDWRDTGHSRAALMATPAIYQGDRLIAAPLAGMQNGWSAQIVADFASYLASH
jgi:tRNA(Ile)-lysidine synthase